MARADPEGQGRRPRRHPDLRLLERPRAGAGAVPLRRPLRPRPLRQARQAGRPLRPPPHRPLRLRRVELRVPTTITNQYSCLLQAMNFFCPVKFGCEFTTTTVMY